MDLSKLRNYLEEEIVQIEEHTKKIKHLFDKQTYQIAEIDNKIKMMKEAFDFAYEAFSPVSQKEEKVKTQIEELRKSQEELRENQGFLKEELDFCSQKKERSVKALEELVSEERAEEVFVQNLEDKYSWILGTEIIEREERERQRIARDLHDTTVQNLTAMIHKIEFCQQIIDMDAIRAKLEMQLIINTIRETVDGMRETIYNLRPMSFDDIGFKETLLRAVERLRKNTDIKIEFHISGEIYSMSPAYELTILRLIQEATNNSKKYSQAENVEISLIYEKNQIRLSVSDNGNGFETGGNEGEKQNSGFGISMMKERVFLLKGKIDIQSVKNAGTQIKVILPRLEPEDKDEYKNIISR